VRSFYIIDCTNCINLFNTNIVLVMQSAISDRDVLIHSNCGSIFVGDRVTSKIMQPTCIGYAKYHLPVRYHTLHTGAPDLQPLWCRINSSPIRHKLLLLLLNVMLCRKHVHLGASSVTTHRDSKNSNFALRPLLYD